jgi:DNA-binding NarL/FixJ family response regulator
MPVRVVLLSDDALARSGLAALLSGAPDIAIVAQGASTDGGALAIRPPPDAVLVDLGPMSEGPESVAAAVAVAPTVALAAHDDEAGEALRAGARGVLFRSAPPDAIAAALVAAARGLAALDAGLATEWLRPPEPPAAEGLTPREREVLALLAEGLGNKTIAARLGISEHTAKFHVNAILAKLGAGSRAEAIVRAARQGLVTL